MNVTGQIKKLALELLTNKPEGLRYSELVAAISAYNSAFNHNTINGCIWNLDAQFPEEVYKADRGLFRLLKFKENLTDETIELKGSKTSKRNGLSEDDFYSPFAEWLVNELEECTRAIPLGGNIFKDKWGTPDVIGVRESKRSDIIQFPTEIISAEIKIDSTGLITAFGQACSYKIFSHKSYIVVPNDSQEEDITRLDTLCRQFGLGLILFTANNKDNPRFEIRARAVKHEPDMFFVNRNLKLIEGKLFS
ncbi:MAG: hypothetical protein ACLQQ4_01610 [Bacteroidia bacterium]